MLPSTPAVARSRSSSACATARSVAVVRRDRRSAPCGSPTCPPHSTPGAHAAIGLDVLAALTPDVRRGARTRSRCASDAASPPGDSLPILLAFPGVRLVARAGPAAGPDARAPPVARRCAARAGRSTCGTARSSWRVSAARARRSPARSGRSWRADGLHRARFAKLRAVRCRSFARTGDTLACECSSSAPAFRARRAPTTCLQNPAIDEVRLADRDTTALPAFLSSYAKNPRLVRVALDAKDVEGRRARHAGRERRDVRASVLLQPRDGAARRSTPACTSATSAATPRSSSSRRRSTSRRARRGSA